MQSLDLSDKVVLITGAGKADGQGATEAKLISELGATVYISDLLESEGTATAAVLGNRVSYVNLDVTDEESWRSVVAHIDAAHGRIDGLVNNAGIWSMAGIRDTDLDTFEKAIRINQIGPFLGIKAVASLMCDAGRGSIVNTVSAAAMRVGVYYWHNAMTAHAYTVTKWALRGITKATAMEFAPFNVRVNAIHPGPVKTSMLGGDLEDIAASIPMKRLGQPADIAGAVAFLLSDMCPFMTGADISIDGGATV